MNGVILFADDHIFDLDRPEHKLFRKFNSEGVFSILPIESLTILEKTVSSISTYRALILDWNFKREVDDTDEDMTNVKIPDDNPLEFLQTNEIFSLIYIYSQEEIPVDVRKELESAFPGKIFFEKKDRANDTEKEYERILEGINKFEKEKPHLKVPFIWSQAINRSAQNIFSELEQADPNWIKEVFITAKNDGTEPNTEVIGVFQQLLNESIIQNEELKNALDLTTTLETIKVHDKEKSLAKLYCRIYYTKLMEHAPLMTGDIFRFSEDEYAILITPECDINSKKEVALEFLTFNKNNYQDFLMKKREYEKSKFDEVLSKGYKKDSMGNPTEEIKGKLRELNQDFNNGDIKIHILPSFPFESDKYGSSALINFETAFTMKSKTEFENKRAEHKLNTPYIFQLRQRYLAYVGRVGVPAIPQSLRFYNLK